MKYKNRIIESKLKEALQVFSAIGLTGPRQSGKSTMLLKVLAEYEYVSFDDFAVVQMFKDDPEKFFRIYNDRIIFDEVQKVPEIFNYIKREVDNDRNNSGKFVLTGSSEFSFIKSLSDSLAGRIALFSLLPYQYSELPEKHRNNAIVFGFYPELVNKDYKLCSTWYSSYLETYVNIDIASMININNLRDFRKLISLLAANVSQTLNATKLAGFIGVDAKTIRRWLAVLEASYIIYQLRPFSNNSTKRMINSPKIYFYDNGLVSFLNGIESIKQFDKTPLKGAMFENFVVTEILKKQKHNLTNNQLFYYRESNSVEVDLILDKKSHKELLEIKSSETFNHKMLSAIEKIKEENDIGYLLYNGVKRPYLEDIQVIPFHKYLLS